MSKLPSVIVFMSFLFFVTTLYANPIKVAQDSKGKDTKPYFYDSAIFERHDLDLKD